MIMHEIHINSRKALLISAILLLLWVLFSAWPPGRTGCGRCVVEKITNVGEPWVVSVTLTQSRGCDTSTSSWGCTQIARMSFRRTAFVLPGLSHDPRGPRDIAAPPADVCDGLLDKYERTMSSLVLPFLASPPRGHCTTSACGPLRAVLPLLRFLPFPSSGTMSQPDSEHTVRNYGMSASFAWLMFEYCITLEQEIDLFWGQKITGASVLYLSNRYLPLFSSLWWVPWWRQSLSFNACVAQQILGGLMEYAIYIPVAAFSALRVYALSGKNGKWAAVTFLLSVSPCLIALVVCPWITFEPDTSTACRLQYNIPLVVQAISVLAGRLFLVLADVVVLSITWSTTFKNWKLRCNIPTISGVIFRDGTIYFIAQLFLNAFYLVSMLLPPDIFDVEDLNSIASLLILPATSILVTHFLLDLQHASKQSLPPINASNWERMMGSIALLSLDVEGHDDRAAPPIER